MGIAHPTAGAQVFNEMDDAASVRELVRTLINAIETGEMKVPESLRKKREGTLPFASINELPWQD